MPNKKVTGKKYQNAPDNIFRGRPDNNYEAYRPHNLTVKCL